MLLSGCCLSERLLDYILQRVMLCVAVGHAVRARGGEMIFEGRIGYPLADECGYGHDGAQAGAYNKNLFGHIILRMFRLILVSVDSGAVPML